MRLQTKEPRHQGAGAGSGELLPPGQPSENGGPPQRRGRAPGLYAHQHLPAGQQAAKTVPICKPEIKTIPTSHRIGMRSCSY